MDSCVSGMVREFLKKGMVSEMNFGEAQILAYNAEIIAARIRVDGMIAENMQRAAHAQALAYPEEAFMKEASYIVSCANSILETAQRTL